MPVRQCQRERYARQPGAAADIEHADTFDIRLHCKTVEQVFADHFVRIAHRGQVVGAVPAVQQQQVADQSLLRRHGEMQAHRAETGFELLPQGFFQRCSVWFIAMVKA